MGLRGVDLNDGGRVRAAEGNLVDLAEEGEFGFGALALDACHHVLRGARTLQLLALELLLFDLVPVLGGTVDDVFGVDLGALAVTAAKA